MHKAARIVLLGVIAGTTGVAAAQSLRPERLIAPRLEEWTIGFYKTSSQAMIREEVPRHQSVDAWTRMVTTQRFNGLATRTVPQAYVGTIAADAPKSCPGAKISPVRSLTISGHPAARLQVDCPSNPAAGGTSETFILLAVSGQSDMHVKQVAFRGGFGPADRAWTERFLSGVALCAESDRSPACIR